MSMKNHHLTAGFQHSPFIQFINFFYTGTMYSRWLRPKPIPETADPIRPITSRHSTASNDPVFNGRDLLLPWHRWGRLGPQALARHVHRRQDQHLGSRHHGGGGSGRSCGKCQCFSHQSLNCLNIEIFGWNWSKKFKYSKELIQL